MDFEEAVNELGVWLHQQLLELDILQAHGVKKSEIQRVQLLRTVKKLDELRKEAITEKYSEPFYLKSKGIWY